MDMIQAKVSVLMSLSVGDVGFGLLLKQMRQESTAEGMLVAE